MYFLEGLKGSPDKILVPSFLGCMFSCIITKRSQTRADQVKNISSA